VTVTVTEAMPLLPAVSETVRVHVPDANEVSVSVVPAIAAETIPPQPLVVNVPV
jgi:hypothetical protein